MKYLSAYVLLVLGGKAEPTAADLTKFLKEIAVKFEAAEVEQLVNALKGKQLHELVRSGSSKLASVSSGPVASAAPAKESAKVVEKEKEKPVEEADVDMGGLFGGDDY